jgi:hypothetical protein
MPAKANLLFWELHSCAEHIEAKWTELFGYSIRLKGRPSARVADSRPLKPGF